METSELRISLSLELRRRESKSQVRGRYVEISGGRIVCQTWVLRSVGVSSRIFYSDRKALA